MCEEIFRVWKFHCERCINFLAVQWRRIYFHPDRRGYLFHSWHESRFNCNPTRLEDIYVAIRITRFNVVFSDILRKSRIIGDTREISIFLRLPDNPCFVFSTVALVFIFYLSNDVKKLYFKIKHLIFVIKLWIFFICFSI